MTSQNHYAVLGVLRSATHTEIKAAYNRLVLKAHPDKGGSQSEFVKIQAAWEVLRDSSARAKFDRKNPYATGVPGQPQPGGKSTRSPDPQFHGSHHSRPAGGNTGFGTKANSDPRTGYRESASGNAYNSYHGFPADDTDDGSPKPGARPTPRTDGTPRNQHHARGHEYPEPGDIPMPDAPDEPMPGKSTHERGRRARPEAHDFNAGGRRRSLSPESDRYPGRPSPPITPVRETEFKATQDLADKAAHTLNRYKGLLEMLLSRTNPRPCTLLCEEIQVKLQHVGFYLSTRELNLKLRVYAVMLHNAELRANQPMTPLGPFYPSLEEAILNVDVENVTDLKHAMARVLRDTAELLRIKRVLESRGKELSDDEKTVRNLKSSTDGLDRLLTKILTSHCVRES